MTELTLLDTIASTISLREEDPLWHYKSALLTLLQIIPHLNYAVRKHLLDCTRIQSSQYVNQTLSQSLSQGAALKHTGPFFYHWKPSRPRSFTLIRPQWPETGNNLSMGGASSLLIRNLLQQSNSLYYIILYGTCRKDQISLRVSYRFEQKTSWKR